MLCGKVISEVCITTLILLALYATDSALIFLAVRILRVDFLEEELAGERIVTGKLWHSERGATSTTRNSEIRNVRLWGKRPSQSQGSRSAPL